jgi:urease accessory protein
MSRRITIMGSEKLFHLLQLAGGTFPTGGFSQSWGLETYVSEETIADGQQFVEFSRMYLDRVIESFEGPVYCVAYDLSIDWAEPGLLELEELVLAMKLTKETKTAGIRTGKALLRMAGEILNDEKLKRYYEKNKDLGISYPVAFGMVCARLEIGKEEGLKALIFSTINSLTQSAVKLIPLGNTEAQYLMASLYPLMEECAAHAMQKQIEEIENFSPGLDIASMRHEALQTRLYMS